MQGTQLLGLGSEPLCVYPGDQGTLICSTLEMQFKHVWVVLVGKQGTRGCFADYALQEMPLVIDIADSLRGKDQHERLVAPAAGSSHLLL